MHKTILITGATDGIGKALIQSLLELNYKVLIHGRNLGRIRQILDEYKSHYKDQIEGYNADLGNFKEVQIMCEEIQKKEEKLDIILHNAGTYEKNFSFNEDGIEKTFAVNFVSNLLINEKLLNFLNKNLQERIEKKEYVKIILVSSIAHQSGVYKIEEWLRPKVYNAYQAYANSKMAQIMYGYYIAKEWEKYNILVNSLHPGVINTKILRENFGMQGAPISEGIKTPFYLITTEEKYTGKYFINQKEQKSSPETYNYEFQKELYLRTKEIIEKYL